MNSLFIIFWCSLLLSIAISIFKNIRQVPREQHSLYLDLDCGGYEHTENFQPYLCKLLYNGSPIFEITERVLVSIDLSKILANDISFLKKVYLAEWDPEKNIFRDPIGKMTPRTALKSFLKVYIKGEQRYSYSAPNAERLSEFVKNNISFEELKENKIFSISIAGHQNGVSILENLARALRSYFSEIDQRRLDRQLNILTTVESKTHPIFDEHVFASERRKFLVKSKMKLSMQDNYLLRSLGSESIKVTSAVSGNFILKLVIESIPLFFFILLSVFSVKKLYLFYKHKYL